MKITSSAFDDGATIPFLYTCEGKNINPPLQFDDVPLEALSLVLIMDDPDVPSYIRKDQMYDHWVVFNLPPNTKKIAEDSIPQGVTGQSSDGKNHYVGPCPPDREHRYFFKLYALNKMLSLPSGATKKEVEDAMEGHILAQATLMGRYKKKT